MPSPSIPFEVFQKRADATRREMKERGIDVLLLTPSVNFHYLAGCMIPRSERLVALLFRCESGPEIVCPRFESERVLSSPLRLKVHPWGDDEDPIAAVRALLGDAPGITIGLEPRTDFAVYMNMVRAIPEARWVDGSPVFRQLRCAKSEEELACIQAAVAITEKMFERVPEILREGMTEREISHKLAQGMQDLGGERAWASALIGENTAFPHGTPGNRRLSAGDPVLIDMGTQIAGYHSDLTRFFAYKSASEHLRQIYWLIAGAQDAAISAIRPGVAAETIDGAARSAVDRHEHGIHFTHRTGHGTGLDLHEDPYLVRGNREPLRAGMVMTVEPGIYLAGRFGVRLEDQILVTDSHPHTRGLSKRAGELPVVS